MEEEQAVKHAILVERCMIEEEEDQIGEELMARTLNMCLNNTNHVRQAQSVALLDGAVRYYSKWWRKRAR